MTPPADPTAVPSVTPTPAGSRGLVSRRGVSSQTGLATFRRPSPAAARAWSSSRTRGGRSPAGSAALLPVLAEGAGTRRPAPHRRPAGPAPCCWPCAWSPRASSRRRATAGARRASTPTTRTGSRARRRPDEERLVPRPDRLPSPTRCRAAPDHHGRARTTTAPATFEEVCRHGWRGTSASTRASSRSWCRCRSAWRPTRRSWSPAPSGWFRRPDERNPLPPLRPRAAVDRDPGGARLRRASPHPRDDRPAAPPTRVAGAGPAAGDRVPDEISLDTGERSSACSTSAWATCGPRESTCSGPEPGRDLTANTVLDRAPERPEKPDREEPWTSRPRHRGPVRLQLAARDPRRPAHARGDGPARAVGLAPAALRGSWTVVDPAIAGRRASG